MKLRSTSEQTLGDVIGGMNSEQQYVRNDRYALSARR